MPSGIVDVRRAAGLDKEQGTTLLAMTTGLEPAPSTVTYWGTLRCASVDKLTCIRPVTSPIGTM